jgi:hypothetical protein
MEKTCPTASLRNMLEGGADKTCRFHLRKGKVMAEAALFIGWGEVARGREKRALDVYNDSLQYYGRLQQEGRIERFDVAVLNPTGGDLGGFIMLRGTAEQIDSARRSEEFQRLQNRVQLIANGLRITDAFVDEGLAQVMKQYEDVLSDLD